MFSLDETLTLLHSERLKLHGAWSFGRSECSRVYCTQGVLAILSTIGLNRSLFQHLTFMLI